MEEGFNRPRARSFGGLEPTANAAPGVMLLLVVHMQKKVNTASFFRKAVFDSSVSYKLSNLNSPTIYCL